MPVVNNIIEQFIKIAKTFPDENLIWIKEDIAHQIDLDDLTANFKGSHYMLSLGNIEHHFLNPAIGYVTDGPFLAVSQTNIYPSWLMQEAAGVIAASIINQFNAASYKNKSLEYFLTSVARIGQPQGLFCYHIPAAFKKSSNKRNRITSIFQFVGQHYKKIWVFILFILMNRYEKIFPFFTFAKALFSPAISNQLSFKTLNEVEETVIQDYDVIIPTMGREVYLKDVLKDLSAQTLLPKKVIIIEQNPDLKLSSELDYLENENWPFEIIHSFIHQTGACNARNLAISKTTASWILLFDDDNRFDSDLLESMFHAIQLTGTKVLNVAYLQKGGKKNYKRHLNNGSFSVLVVL
ncbi:glycosyl transferase [Nonlabens ulvanivorans]|nr:glycosyltransferase [Nonlabens ulvanivorans]GAK93178.1 glycosyl transferase [Nonlabens ulvanivorans]